MSVEVSGTPAPLFLLLSTSGHCLRQATELGAFLFWVEIPKAHLQLFFRPAFLLSFSRHCDLLGLSWRSWQKEMHNIFSGKKRDGVLLVAKVLPPAGSVCVTELCVCAVLIQQAAVERLQWLHGGTREVGWPKQQLSAVLCSLQLSSRHTSTSAVHWDLTINLTTRTCGNSSATSSTAKASPTTTSLTGTCLNLWVCLAKGLDQGWFVSWRGGRKVGSCLLSLPSPGEQLEQKGPGRVKKRQSCLVCN